MRQFPALMMSTVFTMSTALLGACSDYDLHRPDQPAAGADPIDTGEPAEPSEDADILIEPNPIDFGGLPKDCAAPPIEVTISNVGLGDLDISTIELAGDGYSAFGVDWDGAPITLAYQDSTTVNVSFTPASWYDYSVELQVSSNDPDGRADVPTLGTGAEDVVYEQTFEQDYFTTVDVLWVVDNSGSMSGDLANVAANFSSFIEVFIGLDLDYHMALVTTDMDNPMQSGKFLGPVITSESADPIAEFLDQIDQGANGSGSERGFEAINTALTDPLLSTTNVDFLREDAALGTIVLSDEDDDSTMGPTDFVSWFEGMKATDDMTTFSAICDDLFISCYQYGEAADLTGGMTGDISATDYIEVLEQISMTTAGLTISVDLDREPSDLGAVQVMVEGTELPFDASDGWTYDTYDNAIVFHGSGIPAAGESGIVYYPVAGECP